MHGETLKFVLHTCLCDTELENRTQTLSLDH